MDAPKITNHSMNITFQDTRNRNFAPLRLCVRHRGPRRGVLLLLILALLAMFGLIAVAFVVLTGQAQRSAKSIERIDLAMDPPKNLLQQAAMQVFRGTNNTASVMGPHSLLEDMYGNNFISEKTISSVTPVCGGQVLKIASDVTAADIAQRGGCVMTVTTLNPSNAAAQQAVYGQSTRIVYVVPGSSDFYVMAFPSGITALTGVKFTINGVPFSGTGFGWDGTNFVDTLALQPNSSSNKNPLGGANEDYDAADYQNMLLAAQWYDTTNNRMCTIPSLHRPALVRSVGSENANIVLRPLDTAFVNSTSSYFKADWDGTGTTNHWDVDNDGDGVTDSVWVDLGMPVRATNDGRVYKPLFAILCTDLDGRLNLNAHGSLPQTDTGYDTLNPASGNSMAGTPAATNVPRGQGIGPAEIDLSALLTKPANIMSGAASGYQGRYGSTKVPGVSGDDVLSVNKWYQYGNKDYWTATASSTGSYGSPPDPFGAGAVGLDQAGEPAYAYVTVSSKDYGYGSGVTDLPYEFNQSANVRRGLSYGETSGNNPFSASELERLLRPYDRDATGLPARLAALTSASGTAPASSELLTAAKRNAFTTDSWDVPCPAVPLLAAKNLLTALAARCSTKSVWPKLVPAEVLNGLKMNINRPFGNGLAGANGIVDDPTLSTAQTVTFGTSTVTLHYDGADLVTTSLAARQLEARYLYIMMCLTSDLTYLNAKLGGSDKTARFLAQWAVNAVDFKDRDSIMTPFDYDPAWTTVGSSISDWSVTVGTSPRVWGCERPELLITETLAFHDRRTSNASEETDYASETTNPDRTAGGKTSDPVDTATKKTRDKTYDQTYRPQGSLFIELYNPTSKVEPHCTDLYTAAAVTGELKLDKVADGSPVWRLVIATPTSADEQPDPDDPDSAATKPDVEREVYFVAQGAATALPPLGATKVRFYPGTTPAASNVAPGEYAMVGSAEDGATNPNTTYIGFLDTGTAGSAATRRIDLDQSTKLVQTNTNSPADPTTGVAAVKTIPIDTVTGGGKQRLSVSEPVDGYDSLETAGGPDADGKYAVPYDQPFDAQRTDGGQGIFIANGTYPKYRVVYLQRLANPLEKYSATDNPYRTIDMMAIDVTSFNGVCKDEENTEPLDDDPQLPAALPGSMIPTHFQSRQRGERNDAASQYNIWKQEPVEKPETVFTALGEAGTVTSHYFECDLKHSLGYLNQPYGNPTTTPYTGAPTKPFPWLTWNNRPYVSPLELMLVPAVRSSKLLVNAGKSAVAGDFTSTAYNKYFNILKPGDSSSPYSAAGLDGASVPYPHLLNFFQSDKSTSTTTSAQFHRILEYLGVPSPFVSADIQTFPSTPESPFLPPFNRISNYREPGRINLNTIYNQYVFKGLMAGFPAMTTNAFWQKFVASRQGNTAATNNVLGYVSGMPSEFACPFRSFGGYTYSPSDVQTKLASEINCTLLRADPATASRPLFQFDSGSFSSYAADYNDPERNPFFRYQSLARLGNLVTTRSNVYAVWITVGYFEVTSAGKLGQELGVDTGEIDRHRAFYIFDRSIPVGFQRGQDLNVEKAILVNRYIE